MQSITTDLSWLCVVFGAVFAGVMLVFGVLYRLRYARRFWNAYRRGTFQDLNTPRVQARMNRYLFVTSSALLGMVLSFVVFVVQQTTGFFGAYSDVTLLIAGLFGVISIIVALLRHREYDRRL
jgi:hypothetical protein